MMHGQQNVKLRWLFRKWDVGVWTGSNWLRIGTGGGHLWIRQRTLDFHKMRGIYWLVENRLASQVGLCCMEWVKFYTKFIKLARNGDFIPPHIFNFQHYLMFMKFAVRNMREIVKKKLLFCVGYMKRKPDRSASLRTAGREEIVICISYWNPITFDLCLTMHHQCKWIL